MKTSSLRRTVIAGLLLATTLPASAGWLDIFRKGKTVAGSGNIQKQVRVASGFNEIALDLPAYLELRQGEKEGVEIETDDNLQSLIEVVVESGALQIRPQQKNVCPDSKALKITVFLKNLAELKISGWGKVNAEKLHIPGLHIAVSGSGDVRIQDLRTEILEIDISGSGSFSAAGTSTEISGKIGGSGSLLMDTLEANDVRIRIGGSGHVRTWVHNKLDVTVGGSGEIEYYGDPVVTKTIGGSGRLIRLGSAPH